MLSDSIKNAIDQQRRSHTVPTPFVRPIYTVKKDGLNIELWVARRKFPFYLGFPPSQSVVIVPVATDLKMAFGIAKFVRDRGADRAQVEANKAAPLAPGEAFLASGAKYRFRYTALAVIFDENKRTSPQIIGTAIRRAASLATERGATNVILPDFTENLLAQPNWITPEQRRNTAEIAAQLTIQAARELRNMAKVTKIWCWDPVNADSYLRELKRL